MPDDFLAQVGADEFLVGTLAKTDLGKGGKSSAKRAFVWHAAGALFPAAEAAQSGVLLELSDERFGRGNVPEGFGDESLSHLQARLRRSSVACPLASGEEFLDGEQFADFDELLILIA
jgi:hypothetical protein